VLSVHEIENFFLHPPTLTALLEQNGIAGKVAIEVLRDEADARAGSWIFQYAYATPNAKTLPEIPQAAKEKAKSLNWGQFESDPSGMIGIILEATRFDSTSKQLLRDILDVSVVHYGKRRVCCDFWRECEGKQVLNGISRRIGFSGTSTMVAATFVFWEKNHDQLPPEVAKLRAYLSSL